MEVGNNYKKAKTDYYESFNKLLELEKEMHPTIAELNKFF